MTVAHTWTRKFGPPRRSILIGCFGGLSLALIVYLASVLLRPPDSYSSVLDGGLPIAIELGAVALCLARGYVSASNRGFALTVAAALLLWSLGDATHALESLGGVTPPTPALADAFFIAFYPVAYGAVMLYARSQLKKAFRPSWLDGGITSLAAITFCSLFALHGLYDVTGPNLAATATNLAYPIGDLALLGIVVGSITVLPRPGRRLWVLLALGIGLIVLGDTANLFQDWLATTRGGALLNDVAWPAGALVIAAGLWTRERPATLLSAQKTSGLTQLGVATTSSILVLFLATAIEVNKITIVLAAVTLFLISVRVTVSMKTLHQLSQERHHLSQTDELTGLGNRRYLFDLLDDFLPQIERREDRTDDLAYLFVDLNHFKEINDTFGHSAGDEVLRQIGPRLSAGLRESDVVFRLGGDEFVILLTSCDLERATEVAKRLTASLDEPFDVESIRPRIAASIGITTAPRDAQDASGLMHCADIAMYRAKLEGLPFAVYNSGIDDQNRLQFADELRFAINDGQLVVYYQPQLDLRSGEILGLEALVRWQHPRLGILPPDTFLPLAEDADLMDDLSELVLNQALAQLSTWQREGRELVVSVNISPSTLLAPGFSDLVSSLLARHDVRPSYLVIEITESSVISDFERCCSVVRELSQLGVATSIDDFGAGATSLAYLGNLGATELKLDRCFLEGVDGAHAGKDVELIAATIALGHSMGFRVVAEGIESARALEILAELGCDVAQGYFISRPMPVEALSFSSDAGAPARVGMHV